MWCHRRLCSIEAVAATLMLVLLLLIAVVSFAAMAEFSPGG